MMGEKMYLHEAVLREIDAEYEDLNLSVTFFLSENIVKITIVMEFRASPIHAPGIEPIRGQ